MHYCTSSSLCAAWLIIAGCASQPVPRSQPPPRLVRDEAQSQAAAPSSTTPASPTPIDPGAADPEMHAKYAFAVGGGPRSALAPTATLPTLPATIDVRPDAGVATAIKAVPSQVPVGHLSQETLEGPLRNPRRFENCGIPRITRIDVAVVIYNGQAIGVDVRSSPSNRALDFCVERVVRQTSWVKDLAINKVNVTL